MKKYKSLSLSLLAIVSCDISLAQPLCGPIDQNKTQCVAQRSDHPLDEPPLPTILPLRHYEKNLARTTKKSSRDRKVAQTQDTLRADPVLPTNLRRPAYLKHLAKELGWVPAPKQNDFCKGIYTIPQYIKDHPLVDQHAPIEISAKGTEEFKFEGMSVLRHGVVIKQPGRIMYANTAYLFRDGKTGKITKITLRGHVRIYQGHNLFVAEESLVSFYPRRVSIKSLAFHYYNKGRDIKALLDPYNAWGTARSARETPEAVYTLHHATYSTCPPIAPAWIFSAAKIILDRPNNIGKAYNMVFRIKALPIFYFPYLTFPLNNQRKTGFLFPIAGQTSNAGGYFGVPIYFNLAPNYDLLITPQYYGQRGLLLDATYRYLTKKGNGFIALSLLPNDQYFAKFRTTALNTYSNTTLYDPIIYTPYLQQLRQEQNTRGMLNASNYTNFNHNLHLRYYINLVNDPYYLVDVITPTLSTSATTDQLLNLIQIQQATEHWDNSLSLQGYQTLHLITQIQNQGQALDQYQRLPDLATYDYYPINNFFSFESHNEYTNFNYYSPLFQDKPTGSRFHVRPGLSLDLENSAGYFKPELWYDITGYVLSPNASGVATSVARTMPLLDLDLGLHLSRNFTLLDNSYKQTLEPRLFYLYVPFKNQDELPNFDTIELPFFFNQLYALNAFQGVDRLENANQVSLGLSTDIIRSTDDLQLLTLSIGDIYYISQPRVCLIPGCTLTRRNFSPLIANFTLLPNARWHVNGSIAWDPKYNLTDNAQIGLSYNNAGHRVFNVSYLYVNQNFSSISTFNDSPLASIEATGFTNSSSHLIANFTWPLSKQVRTLGYANYDFRLHRLNSIYAGVQLDSCCWAVRLIIKRLFNSSTFSNNHLLNNAFEMSYFVELTFKGLGSFGSGSDTLVQSIIPGYKS